MADTVKVGCRIPNGVRLRVSDRVDSPEEPGKKVLREIGTIDLAGPVSGHGERFGPAPTETVADVDGRLFKRWMAENKDSDLVTSGMVYEVKDEKSPAPPKDVEPAKALDPAPASKK